MFRSICNFTQNSIRLWNRKELRNIMRGYIIAKKGKKFSEIREIRSGIVDVTLNSHGFWGDRDFYGIHIKSAELPARQYLLEHLDIPLNKALFGYLGSKKPICLGMPREWRNYLSSNGWEVNKVASIIAWWWKIFALYACNIIRSLIFCAKVSRGTPVARESVPGKHVFFDSLGMSNLPSSNSENYDICTFYAHWHGGFNDLTRIFHNVKKASERNVDGIPVIYHPHVWELNVGRNVAMYLTWWACKAIIAASLQLFTGRWRAALLLQEALRAYATRLCPSNILADEYLFHFSGNIYRPLWTYEVEQKGAKVAVYFYSTYEQPKLAHGYETQKYVFGPNSWKNFIIWDVYQEHMLRRSIGEGVIFTIAGSIKFSDCPKPIPPLPMNSFVAFTVQSHRSAAHFGISTSAELTAEHPDYYQRFLLDIAEIVTECGGTTIVKDKRPINNRGKKSYQRKMGSILSKNRVIEIDSEISAMRLIKFCRAGISLPFTSTAIYLRDCGLPSIFYDPTGWIQRDDSAAHGIPIVQGREELRIWVKQVLCYKI